MGVLPLSMYAAGFASCAAGVHKIQTKEASAMNDREIIQ